MILLSLSWGFVHSMDITFTGFCWRWRYWNSGSWASIAQMCRSFLFRNYFSRAISASPIASIPTKYAYASSILCLPTYLSDTYDFNPYPFTFFPLRSQKFGMRRSLFWFLRFRREGDPGGGIFSSVTAECDRPLFFPFSICIWVHLYCLTELMVAEYQNNDTGPWSEAWSWECLNFYPSDCEIMGFGRYTELSQEVYDSEFLLDFVLSI